MAVFAGGGSGIGRAICQKLAENGARVVVVDRTLQAAADTVAKLPSEYR